MTTAGPSLPPLIDTHAHLCDPGLTADLQGVLQRARAAGVVQIVAIATDAADSSQVLELARTHPGIFAAVGVHPNEAAAAVPGDWDKVVGLAGRDRVVAIGETGLDRYRDRTPFPVQQQWFGRHLELARLRNLPVVIHCRDCEQDVIDQLAELAQPVRGVLHSFTGDAVQARAFLDLGLHLSFAGMLTFTNKGLDALRETAAVVPLDRLLVETDSPYLSPHPFRGRPNEPGRVALTADRLAQIHGLDLAELARITAANARALFGLPENDLLAQ